MSMVIFMSYLFLFFIVIRPHITPSIENTSLISLVEQKYVEEVTYFAEKIPLIIKNSQQSFYEPIVVDFPEEWNFTKLVTSGNFQIINNNKIIMLTNTTENKEEFIAETESFSINNVAPPLSSDDTSATVKNYNVIISNAIANEMYYSGKTIIKDSTIKIDDSILDEEFNYREFNSIANYYLRDSTLIDSYVFTETTGVYTFFNSLDLDEHIITQTFNLGNFSEYIMADNVGEINYGVNNCYEFNENKIVLQKGIIQLTIFLSEVADFELCTNENNLTLEIIQKVTPTKSSWIKILLSEKEISALDVKKGFRQKIRSVSKSKVSELEVFDYAKLKAKWGIAESINFNILFTSTNYNSEMGTLPGAVNIYAKNLILYEFTGEGFIPTTSTMRVWNGQ